MRVRHPFRALGWWLAAAFLLVLLMPGVAWAQEIEITPSPTVTFSSQLSPGTRWVFWMALGASVIAILIVLAALAGYLRFAPKFGGREETARPLPPGARPRELVRQAAQIRYTPPPAAATPPPAAAASAPAPAPVLVPARDPAMSEGASVAAEASSQPTAGPESEPAVQADATGQAEAAAPEPRPSAKTAQEVGAPEQSAPAAAATAPAPAPAASGSSRGAQLDQETFDRVLEEQLGKGVDRRVAEGRARAAAVVAARKKAEG